jgi:hypothetical protein
MLRRTEKRLRAAKRILALLVNKEQRLRKKEKQRVKQFALSTLQKINHFSPLKEKGVSVGTLSTCF